MSEEAPSNRSGVPVSQRRILITGIEGFTGRYLKQHLEHCGHIVHGLTLERGDGVALHQASLLDPASLKRVVEHVRPHHVIHLAAVSSITHQDVAQIYSVNITGTRNLLATLATLANGVLRSVLLASSGNIYGNCGQDLLTEDLAARPMNDYAVSKFAMEAMAALWANRMSITIVRPFNYTGRGQSEKFLVPKIVAAFRRRASEIELGNTHVERDFSDVRDVVACYERLMISEWAGLTNVCSGNAISLNRILGLCEEITGHQMRVRINPELVRANEVHRLSGSRDRLSALGVPAFRPFQETLAWMLESEAGTPSAPFGSTQD